MYLELFDLQANGQKKCLLGIYLNQRADCGQLNRNFFQELFVCL